jgi:hypothetical protein
MGLGLYQLAKAEPIPMVRPVTQYTPPQGPTLVEVFAPEDSRDETEDEFLARVLASADRSVAKARVQNRARIRVASDKPIGIVFEGDFHAATEGTDLRWILSRADMVANTDGIYALGIGDMMDNPIKHKGGDIADVKDQLRLLDIIVARHRGKLLGTVSGNHDDWTKTTAGFDHLKSLALRHKMHFAPDELLWDVEIVDPNDAEHVTAQWTVATRHQFRRHSNLNPLHACWRWLEEQVATWERIPDVLVLAHNHTAAVGVHNYQGKDVWGVRMGSAQTDSGYARAKGFTSYRPTAPVAVLPATQSGRIQCFADGEAAITYMRGGVAEAA